MTRLDDELIQSRLNDQLAVQMQVFRKMEMDAVKKKGQLLNDDVVTAAYLRRLYTRMLNTGQLNLVRDVIEELNIQKMLSK